MTAEVVLTLIGAVSVALIGGAVTVFGHRFNDRQIASQEVDLLKKLNPSSRSAHQLEEVISARVMRWHRQWYQPASGGQKKSQLRRFPWLISATVIGVLAWALFFAGVWVLGVVKERDRYRTLWEVERAVPA